MNKNYEAIHRYDFLTHNLLVEEYVKNGLTDREIAEKYNMPSKAVVWRKRKKYGIENRTPSKSNKNASKNRKFKITKEEADKLKKEGKTFKEIAEYMGCSEIVAKRRFKELETNEEKIQVEKPYCYYVILSQNQKQLLIGSTLGSGTLNKHNAYYCNHSIKQLKYIHHKIKVLSNISSGSYHHIDRNDLQGNSTKTISFTTSSNRYIVKLKGEFYPNNDKIFPYNLCIKHLKAEGIAYWYMDNDSWKISHNMLKMLVDNLEKKEIDKMITFFTVKHNFDVKLHKSNIVFTKESTNRFIEIVRPYIISSMTYKLGE